MPDGVSVVVVTTTNAGGLAEALARVRAEPEVAEVVVVLNAATEPVRAVAAAAGVRTLASDVPLGLAGGANLGADATTGDHILHLHDDAFGEPGWVGHLLAALAGDPDAGAAGPTTLGADGRPTAAGWLLDREAHTIAAAPGGAAPARVDYCGSSCLLVRRGAWEAAGGFDDRFHPAYFVDVDFALALRARGWAELCAPAARVIHAGGTSSPSRLRAFAGARNRERLLAKWPDAVAGQPAAWDAGAAARRTYRPGAAPAQRDPAGDPAAREIAFRRAFAEALLAEVGSLEQALARAQESATWWEDAAGRHAAAAAALEPRRQ